LSEKPTNQYLGVSNEITNWNQRASEVYFFSYR
jgi:hypothetical protein